jgi:hypothetical protein
MEGLTHTEDVARPATLSYAERGGKYQGQRFDEKALGRSRVLLSSRGQNPGSLRLNPDKADTPAPADLREAEFETVRGFYADGLVRQIWLRGDAGGASMILEGASIEEVRLKARDAAARP